MKFVFDWHGQDSRATGPLEVAKTVTAQYGTGGGNTPIVVQETLVPRKRQHERGGVVKSMATTLKACNVQILAAEVEEGICIQGSMIGRADKNGPQGSGLNKGVCFTLNTIDRHAVAYTFGKTSRPHFKGDAPTYRQLDTANTVNTFDTGESRANELAVQGVPPHYIVRRLMPIECGRLQGFPDGWGEIEQLPADMPEEAAAFWRGVYATDCAIKGKRAQKAILERADKLAAWHNSLHTDSAEYKMWGNGMALPNALFFVSRALAQISAEEKRPVESLKLGSLFDGSGTMPLCATMCGAKAAWASEVEPYPIAVTKTHLPRMKHLGSVTDICGGNIEPVDIITFGSPCQDLSVAGKRTGLDGNRSGLFREAIRIILEMLAATNRKYPRFVIWENVPGLYHRTEGKTLKPYLTNCCDLPGQTSLFDSLECGANLGATELLPTDLSMRNTGECPNDAEEFMLSQILVENPPTKYYLSVKALDGILNRASRRGEKLPELLVTAITGAKAWWAETLAEV